MYRLRGVRAHLNGEKQRERESDLRFGLAAKLKKDSRDSRDRKWRSRACIYNAGWDIKKPSKNTKKG